MYQLRELFPRFGGHTAWIRERSTDPEVVCDTFIWEEYGQRDLDDVKFVIDCGSYAGYSTIYFLGKYPLAHVLAIEADERNMAICDLNVAAYGARARTIRAAIWGSPQELALSRGAFADGREWATIVRSEGAGNAGSVQGVTVAQLIDSSGFDRLDILKMNVEGSEQSVFDAGTEAWLPRTRNLIVSLHDQACDEAFYRALLPYGFYLSRFRNATYCTKLAPAKAPASSGKLLVANLLKNGDFESYGVAPALVEAGGWTAGSSEPAAHWKLVVADPQLEVSLAVRLGLQRSGENALHITNKHNRPIAALSAPYAALQNETIIQVRSGERYQIAVDVNIETSGAPPDRLTWGFYSFLRVAKSDGSYEDIAIPALHDVTHGYRTVGADVTIPGLSPTPRSATAWLYAWLDNGTEAAASTGAEWTWQVCVDDFRVSKVAA